MNFKHITSLFQSKQINRSAGGFIKNSDGNDLIAPTSGTSNVVPMEGSMDQMVKKFTPDIGTVLTDANALFMPEFLHPTQIRNETLTQDAALLSSFAGFNTSADREGLNTLNLPISNGGVNQSFVNTIIETPTLSGSNDTLFSTGGWTPGASDQILSFTPTTTGVSGNENLLNNNTYPDSQDGVNRLNSTGGVIKNSPQEVEMLPSSSHVVFGNTDGGFLQTGASWGESTGKVVSNSSTNTINTDSINVQTSNETLAEFDFQHFRERSRSFGSLFRTMQADSRTFDPTSGGGVALVDHTVPNQAIDTFSLSDGNYLTSNDINLILQSMNGYAASHDIAITSIESVKANQDLMNIVTGGWHQ